MAYDREERSDKPAECVNSSLKGRKKHINVFNIKFRAEIITELILKRACPVIFKTFLLELIAFRPIPVICPARGVKPENYWKR